ncbi:MAG: PIG-L family deacetylase [Candidatus Sumerlaeota bacterium]|nr:PIG-L family deacetylase [Candidatus Sumerlaeota bacterium]
MDRLRRMRMGLIALAALCAAAAARAVDVAPDQGEVAIRQARLELKSDATVLCLAAHPDDEDSDALAYCRDQLGLRTIVLLATRGEGGQNEIGPELYRDLGVLRTRETEAAARLTGAEVRYLNFIDFGYSKSPEETFAEWGGKEAVVERLTAELEALRPDIVITNHGLLQDHGQHQACGQALLEAFDRVSSISKLYMRRFDGAERPANSHGEISINVGEYDPLRGLCYSEIALAALRLHRSQGTWPATEDWKAPQFHTYELMRSRVKVRQPESRMTNGLAKSRLPGAPQREGWRALFLGAPASAPALFLPFLGGPGKMPARTPALPGTEGNDGRLKAGLHTQEMREREKRDRLCALEHHVYLRALADDDVVVPGQRMTLHAQVFNGGGKPIYVSALSVSSGWIPGLRAEEPADPIGAVPPGERKEAVLTVEIPKAPGRGLDILTRPASVYWYTKDRTIPLFEVRARVNLGGKPSARDAFLTPPAALDPELRAPIELEGQPPEIPALLGRREPVEVLARARNNSLENLDGVQAAFVDPFTGAERVSKPFALRANGGEATPEGLLVRVPATAKPGVYPARVALQFPSGLPPAVDSPAPLETRLHVLDVKVAPGLRVGLVKTYDDSQEQALRVLGVNCELLDSTTLRRGDLGRYDAVLLDLRAYEARPDVVEYNDRLLDYVKRGGNLIVSYNKSFEWNREDRPGFAPYPLRLGRDRVTREDAPVTILNPRHPHFAFPNRITETDFQGWVQERNLYLPSSYDSRYEELLECHDPDEPARPGGHLFARYGKGTYTYTCYVWYRQLRALNPGAYRVFANMISIGKAP